MAWCTLIGLLIPRVALIKTTDAFPITSPAISLLVYNTATTGSTSFDVTPGYYYWNGTAWVRLSTNATAWQFTGNAGTTQFNFIGTTENSHFRIKTNNAERVIVDNTGKVGIGTSTPTAMLEVNGGINADSLQVNGDIHALGKVGIGTSTPAFKLDVNGDASETILHIKNANADANASQFIIEANTDLGASSYSAIEFRANPNGLPTRVAGRIKASRPSPTFSDASLTFQTIGPGINGPSLVDVMSLTNGRVGIGTPNPDQALTVNGNASKQGGGSWATYSDVRLKKISTIIIKGLKKYLRYTRLVFNTTSSQAILMLINICRHYSAGNGKDFTLHHKQSKY